MIRFLILIVALFVSISDAFSTGSGSCTHGGVKHGVSAQRDDVFDANVTTDVLNVPGALARVSLFGPYEFKGFAVQLLADGSPLSSWTDCLDGTCQTMTRCSHVMTHTKAFGQLARSEMSLEFYVPSVPFQVLEVLVTVVESFERWFRFEKTFELQHGAYRATEARSATRVEPEAPTIHRDAERKDKVWVFLVHAFFMAFAFLILLPTSARIASLKTSQWLRHHQKLNALASFFIAVAVWTMRRSTAFEASAHARFGYGLLVLLMAQIILALLRPKQNSGKTRRAWKRTHVFVSAMLLSGGTINCFFGALALGQRNVGITALEATLVLGIFLLLQVFIKAVLHEKNKTITQTIKLVEGTKQT